MSGRGETPHTIDPAEFDLAFGQTLYTEDGHAVGTVRGVEDGGLYLSGKTSSR
ncbi:hypothetical protein SAMN05216388_101917 [Halorientalis persicus]|jgi:hypothetical protein|uniref:PRC-barrel domain containing protein n=1 Tax=Halorientalis persicus TaxID=1367881 RepID=A0A1H8SH26_9EURY|nr:hypothetical protein SAMN05216388_101917 [Halorientalis persicus]